MKPARIRTQVALMTAALIALTILVIATVVIRGERAIVIGQFQDRQEALIQGIKRIAGEAAAGRDPLMLPSYLMFLQKDHPELAFWEFNSGGYAHHSGEERPGLTYVSRVLGSREFPLSTGEAVRRIARPASGYSVTLKLGFRTRALNDEIERPLGMMIRKTIGISIILLIFGVITAIYLSEVLTRPLNALEGAAQAVGSGRLDVVAPVAGSRETRSLAERFNQMVGRLKEFINWRDYLLQAMTHDMNTPLGGLKAYLELMEDGKFPSGEEGRRSILTLLSAVAKMQELMGNTLAFFHTQENGRRSLRREEVDVDALCAEVMALFYPLSGVKRISLRKPDSPARLWVLADRELFRHVLTNLVSNAMKYTPHGGDVRLGAEASGDAATVWVADNGRGISQEDLPHIFEKFRRGKSAGGVPGTGLGLSIVRDAVAMMGGHIRVESWPGKGSRFSVALPLARQALRDPAQEMAS
ncbi:MAG: HAMP domain-containing sensor histidine kinase [Elusimicrobiota bacterium]